MSRSANAAVTAVYSGTFDPLTLGHEDAIRRAAHPPGLLDYDGVCKHPHGHNALAKIADEHALSLQVAQGVGARAGRKAGG